MKLAHQEGVQDLTLTFYHFRNRIFITQNLAKIKTA